MVFNEASSWWTSQQVVLPNSKDIEDEVQEKMREKSGNEEERNNSKQATTIRTKQIPSKRVYIIENDKKLNMKMATKKKSPWCN